MFFQKSGPVLLSNAPVGWRRVLQNPRAITGWSPQAGQALAVEAEQQEEGRPSRDRYSTCFTSAFGPTASVFFWLIVWLAARLPCIERHLAIHTTEEMLRYLQHVFRAWKQITLEDPELATAADVATIRGLELRVPGFSRSDATAVREMMRSGILFSRIAEPAARIWLQESILRVECIIPSFATFHDNMNYLGVGMQIVRDNLLGNIGEKTV